jgi:ACT domain-containing protein
MTMILEISKMKTDFQDLTAKMKAVGDKLGVVINIQHEDIFYSMHRI